jgi:hypothetical protein
MKLLDLFFHKKALLFIFFGVVAGGTFSKILAQTNKKNDWSLPQHQINLLYGTGGQAAQSNHNTPSSNTVLGLAYFYNPTPYLFASVNYQFSYSNFDLMTTKKNYISRLPDSENPVKVSLVKSANLFEDKYGQPKAETNLFELTNNEGFMRRSSYNFIVGYMKATSRNILRIGIGYSFTNVTGRFTESETSTVGPLHTLYTGEQKKWVGNIMLSYDFFFNQNLSLGVHFNGFMENNPTLAGCLTLGYSPVFKAKSKKNPKV